MSTVPSGCMPLTAPIVPVREAADVEPVDGAQRGRDPVRRDEVAQAGRVRVPLAGELVGHDAVRARAAAVVVGVVVAAPEPGVEGGPATFEPALPAARRRRSAPRRRAIAAAAATAASQSEPPYADGPCIGQVS